MRRRTQRRLGLAPPHPARNDYQALMEMADLSPGELRRELKSVFLADTTEISGIWKIPCRHCHGLNNQFQYTGPELRYVETAYSYGEHDFPFAAAVTSEFSPVVQNHANAAYLTGKAGKEIDIKGGGGYSRMHPINPDCPQCSGLGESLAYICDTRNLSEGARRLFKGVKLKTAGEIEIMTIDRQHIRDMLARDLRVGIERKEIQFNFPRTREEFDELLNQLPARELETMIASLVIEGEGYVVDPNTDPSQPPIPPQALLGKSKFQRGN